MLLSIITDSANAMPLDVQITTGIVIGLVNAYFLWKQGVYKSFWNWFFVRYGEGEKL